MIEVLLTEERKLKGYLFYTKLLHWASSVGSIALVKLLALDVIYRDNPKRAWSRCDEAMRCAQLMVNAAKHSRYEMVTWFIDSNQVELSFVNESSCGILALKKAAQRGHTDTVGILLSYITDTLCREYNKYNTALFARPELDYIFNKAAQSGYLQIVRLLANATVGGEYLVNPASEDNYAIQGAAKNNQQDVVRFLLEYRRNGELCVDPTANNNEALRTAQRKQFEWTEDLLMRDERVYAMYLTSE